MVASKDLLHTFSHTFFVKNKFLDHSRHRPDLSVLNHIEAILKKIQIFFVNELT